jgi:hypothetical protein
MKSSLSLSLSLSPLYRRRRAAISMESTIASVEVPHFRRDC